MASKKFPKLRKVEKIVPPYPLNRFPQNFAHEIGKQIIYTLATKSEPSIEGSDWERIFANAIGADWKPSNVGLDDIILKNCAWGAKTLKDKSPWKQKKVRLISGRNSPVYSYGSTIDVSIEPTKLGGEILGIWNARVDSIRSKFEHARTVVLIKSQDLLNLTIFETELLRYDPVQVSWKWNKRGNLEGFIDQAHHFTWQPHGSQFTIREDVPAQKLCLRLKAPEKVDEAQILEATGFDSSWIEIVETH